MPSLNSSLQRLSSIISRLSSEKIPSAEGSLITDFKEKKQAYLLSQYSSSLQSLLSFPGRALLEQNPQNSDSIAKIESLLAELRRERSLEKSKEILGKIAAVQKSLAYPKKEKALSFSINNLPAEISDEMKADLSELEACFNAASYRASIILCARLLETALHRKYYESTNNDLLEKAPGIGLGNLIAKLKDRNIALDPAISQQIHLINQVRIYSVHKKKQPFIPTKEQAHAIILYTIDIIRKLFS
ncbi:DUF4145 domain-containing protein [Candidatus Woesearchaeota archaeon]|nr:DUF4145 domain-containing protein [Candidatus Woesearchaeota archaeon]